MGHLRLRSGGQPGVRRHRQWRPWSRDIRSPGGGDNLYLSSILALNADDGELVWHYQTTPGDDWDYTATQPMMLLDLTIDGRERKVIVQAPKNGLFFVIDRLTGEFISGQAYADDLTWASGIDQDTGQPIETPEARYGTNRQGAWLSPAPFGAHNWRPMAWNPATGLVYLPAQNNVSYYEMVTDFQYTLGQWNTGTTILGGGGPRPDRPSLTGHRTQDATRGTGSSDQHRGLVCTVAGRERRHAVDRGQPSVLGIGKPTRRYQRHDGRGAVGDRGRRRDRNIHDVRARWHPVRVDRRQKYPPRASDVDVHARQLGSRAPQRSPCFWAPRGSFWQGSTAQPDRGR
jgi:hypothetical protein